MGIKTYGYKWTHAVQTNIVQGSTVYEFKMIYLSRLPSMYIWIISCLFQTLLLLTFLYISTDKHIVRNSSLCCVPWNRIAGFCVSMTSTLQGNA